jgi:anti-sigma B factor antagonist
LALTITTRKSGEVTVVNAVGRINLGAGSVTLRETLLELSVGDHPKIVLNLSGVSNMDSSGIGELVSGFTATRSRGGALKLAALPKRISDLLRMTGIYKIFEIHDDEARAIHSFE